MYIHSQSLFEGVKSPSPSVSHLCYAYMLAFYPVPCILPVFSLVSLHLSFMHTSLSMFLCFFLIAQNFLHVSDRRWCVVWLLTAQGLHHPDVKIMKEKESLSLSWSSSIKSEGESLNLGQRSGIELMLGPITVAKGTNN